MASGKKWLYLALFIIALFASLEVTPRTVVMKLTIPSDSSFIDNTGPYGTSKLAEYLESKGLDVATISSIEQINELELNKYTDIIYLVIAPVNFTIDYANEVSSKLSDLMVSKRVHVVVFDEYPLEGETALSLKMEKNIGCSQSFIIKASSLLSNQHALIYFRDGVSLPSGYTSYIVNPSSPDIPLYNIQVSPELFFQISSYTGERNVIPLAFVWPGVEGGSTWSLVAGACKGGKGGVVLVADSTIAINMAGENDTRYLDESYKIIVSTIPESDRLSGSANILVVVDEYIYSSNPNSLAIRFHPSFIIVYLSSIYSNVEKTVIYKLEEHNLLGLVGLILGLLVVLSSWLATSYASRISSEEEKRRFGIKGRLGSVKRKLALPRFFAWHSTLVNECERIRKSLASSNVEELIRLQEDPDSRALVEELYRELDALCKRVNIIMQYLPIWGFRISRVREVYEILSGVLKLSPLNSIEESE